MLTKKMNAYCLPQQLKKRGLYPFFRPIESEQDTVVHIDGKKVLMFGSNSYLGLTNHPKLKESAQKAIEKYGSGCAGSRFLNGTLDLHLELEARLAQLVGKEAALVFSTGYQVNVGVIDAIPRRHDWLILDELNHASILDGARLSFGRVRKYKHNDMEALEKVLRQAPDDVIKLIITDGVFSMEGDIARLPEMVALARKYDANIMIDDAHGIGVLGRHGQGTAHHFGLTKEVDLIMGTFSKSLASIGGFIAADKATINYLQHHARSLMFSASIAPSNAASVLAALEILEQEPERIERLWSNTVYAMEGLRALGFDIGRTETPIIPIYIRQNEKTFLLTQLLLKAGIFVNPVAAPAVASDSSLIRFSLMATHTISQIDEALNSIHKIAKKLDILEPDLSSELQSILV